MRRPILATSSCARWWSSPTQGAQQLAHPILKGEEEPQKLFLDFSALVELLREQFDGPVTGAQDAEKAAEITKLLRSIRFNKREWQQYTNFVGNRYTRTLVGFDPNFAVLLLSWERGQTSPIHCHMESSCWVKVLDGQIQETIYDYPDSSDTGNPLRLNTEAIYSPEQATYIDDSYGVHKMGNPSMETPCVSLHIYSPPFSACNIFDRVSGMKKLISFKTVYDTNPPPEVLDTANNAGSVKEEAKSKQYILKSVDKISLETFVERVKANLSDPESNPECISALLEKLVLSPDEWERFVHFGERFYTRNLLLLNESFSIMLLCWNTQQATPPHTHGDDKQSWFKVLRGELEMTTYKDDVNERFKLCAEAKSEPEISHKKTIRVGDPVQYEAPNESCHKLGNTSDTDTAVSIHVYSPPYVQLKYECSSGEMKRLPVVHYGEMFNQIEHIDERWRGCDLYSNFPSFRTLLDEAFARAPSDDCPTLHANVCNLLEQIQLNPEEWKAQAKLNASHFTRVLVGQSERWMLILTCWDRDQGTPIHDHQGSYNWIKVLEGQLREENYRCRLLPDSESDEEKAKRRADGEKQYEEHCVQLTRSGTLHTDSVTFLDSDIVHRIRNISGKPAFSLHLYSPPYVKAQAYDLVSGDTELVFLPHEYDGSMTPTEAETVVASSN